MKHLLLGIMLAGVTLAQTTPELTNQRKWLQQYRDEAKQRASDSELEFQECRKQGKAINAQARTAIIEGDNRKASQLMRNELFVSTLAGFASQSMDRNGSKVLDWQRMLDHLDECASTYKTTIDKKTSDLTTREADLVKSCKAMFLYPARIAEPTADISVKESKGCKDFDRTVAVR